MVKNAVIVPVGAKGGFFCQAAARPAARPRRLAGRGRRLLQDVHLAACSTSPTTWSAGETVPAASASCATTATTPTWSSPPTRAPRRSPTSPTASSKDYGFWLGDAFASGGSAGYDHKAMGITARGAWESVKRHFRELGTTARPRTSPSSASATCPATCSATACCCREHIRLVAAFDHRHIFLDPDPDPATSFAERKRLFELPRSSLGRLRHVADLAGRRRVPAHGQVDPAHPGGPRRARHRPTTSTAMTPAELMKAILLAAGRPALERRHRHLRQGVAARPTPTSATRPTTRSGSTAADLRCRVVGEGGNLGLTQRGRIEYARARRPDQHRLHRQLRRRRHLRPRGQHQDPARPASCRRRRPHRRSSATSCWRR